MRRTIGIDASPLARGAFTGTEHYTELLVRQLTKLPDSRDFLWILYSATDKPDSLTLPDNWQWKKLSWPIRRFWLSGRLSFEMLMHPIDMLFVPANALPRILPKKVVTTVHDIAFLMHHTLYSPDERSHQIRSFKRSLKKANAIITISETTRKDILRFDPDCDRKLQVIYLAIDNAMVEEVRKKAKRPMPKKYLLCIGTISKKKNTSYLIQLYEEMRLKGLDKQLVLIGKQGFGAEDILARISKSVYRTDIQYAEWLPDEQVMAYLAHADALFIPSRAEGFSLPILEAQALDRPLFISDIQVHHEIAETGAVYFTLDNPEVAARTCLETLTAEEKMRSIASKGQKNRMRFSSLRMAEETLNLIKKTF